MEALEQASRRLTREPVVHAGDVVGDMVRDAQVNKVQVDTTHAFRIPTLDQEVFADARRRIALTFRFRLAFAIILAAVLTIGVAGCIIFGLLGQTVWAVVWGGISVADLLAFAFTKPLKAITDSVTATQRLELVHLRLISDLNSCQALTTTADRIKCEAKAWKSVERSLDSMSFDGSAQARP
jgi:ABC-type multidrug transport system fused ATPase/permease subunit